MPRIFISFPEDYDPVVALEQIIKIIEKGRISHNGASYCSLTSVYNSNWKEEFVVLAKNYSKSDSFKIFKEKEKKDLRKRGPAVWIKKNLEILKEACLVCDSWRFGNNPVEKYLKDHGVETTWASAASMATKKKYPRPHMVKGGKR
jgi:hypothetical protein